jgi:hypothetical protein
MAGQLVACTVTASDGKSGTDTDTGSVTVGNTAPVVTSVTLSPSTVYTSDTLTATVVSSDADGDSLTTSYAWYVGGSLVSATSATLSGSSYFSKGQAVYVTATVNDGTTSTSLSSSAITVSNTAPTAPGVEITPADAVSGDDLTCAVTTAATDVDGDALTYVFAWDVDGVDYTSATDAATSSVVDGADVGGGEAWTCDVTPSDGTAVGATFSESVAVAYGTTTWTSVWSHPLASAPTGSIYYDGGWLDQYAGTMYGRSAWVQPSDWNGMYIPAGRSSTDLEAVEIDVYVPAHSWAVFSPLANYLDYALTQDYAHFALVGTTGQMTVQYDASTTGVADYTLTSSLTGFTSGTWHTVRVEYDYSLNETSFSLDGIVVYDTTAIPLSTLSDAYVVLGTGTTCCSSAANVAWSNLRVYQGTR